MIQIGLYPHKCKNCGKRFEARSEYVYKRDRANKSKEFDWFCSYRCLREAELKEVTKKSKWRKRLVE